MLDEFTAMKLTLELRDPPENDIYVKLSRGTELFNQVVVCSEHLEITPTKAARILMRAGWLGYIKSYIIEMRRKQK